MPLDPQATAFLRQLAEQQPPGWETLPPGEGRSLFREFVSQLGTGPELVRVEDQQVAGHIPVRIYQATTETPRSVLVYFHGGGWVLGDLDTHDALCRELASASQALVVSVHYRRAPEHPFPAALEDCFAVTADIAERPQIYGGPTPPVPLVICGDSAGGHLAAGVALKARDAAAPRIDLQVLVYPVTNDDFETASYRAFADEHGLTRAAMMWFWEQYLPRETPPRPPTAAPLQAGSLEGLPPTHVITAEFDVLRDEGEAYARRLAEATVPTTCRRYEGQIHGFMHMFGVFDQGRRAIAEIGRLVQTLAADFR